MQIAEDIEDIIVTTVFRKAVGERIYCGFYAELCADILRFELEMKGYPAMRSNIKHSNFRRKLLEKCCEQFQCIFTKYEPIEGEDDKESRLRHKERLFGNIDFVGELYRQNLLTEMIIFQCFSSLLGLDETIPNEDTLEASLNLIYKVGDELQKRISSGKKAESAKKEAEVYKRFDELMDGNCTKMVAPQRFQLLIKNMLEDRKTGWKKTSDKNTKLKTKQEVEREEARKTAAGGNKFGGQERTAEPASNNQQRQGANKTEKKGPRESEADKRGNKKRDNNKGGQGKNSQYQKKEGKAATLVDITEAELTKKMIKYFKFFIGEDEDASKKEEEKEDKEVKDEVKQAKDFKIMSELRATTRITRTGE